MYALAGPRVITIGPRSVVGNDVDDDRAARNRQSRVVDDEESASARPETRSLSLAPLAIGFHLDLASTKISLRSCRCTYIDLDEIANLIPQLESVPYRCGFFFLFRGKTATKVNIVSCGKFCNVTNTCLNLYNI